MRLFRLRHHHACYCSPIPYQMGSEPDKVAARICQKLFNGSAEVSHDFKRVESSLRSYMVCNLALARQRAAVVFCSPGFVVWSFRFGVFRDWPLTLLVSLRIRDNFFKLTMTRVVSGLYVPRTKVTQRTARMHFGVYSNFCMDVFWQARTSTVNEMCKDSNCNCKSIMLLLLAFHGTIIDSPAEKT